MAIEGLLLFCFVALAVFLLSTEGADSSGDSAQLDRSSFPAGFVFGAASASYQYEGAAFEDGRGPSMWDTFTHKHSGGHSFDERNGFGCLQILNLMAQIVSDAVVETAMAIKGRLLFCYMALAVFLLSTEGADSSGDSAQLDRSSFPAGFVFGAASASYQYEGAAFEDGRGPSMWDTFTHKHPEKIADHSTGDTADDFYHCYKEDIVLMKEMGLDAFRFSISWPRLFPKGKRIGGVNMLGVKFYNSLIDEVLLNGLEPYVTLFHWDTPQALVDDYGGFLSPKIVVDYCDYVDFCFKTFGDRVKHWLTLNEPYEFSFYGYLVGSYAPGRCSKYIGNCTFGDSSTEPYTVGHHLILSHAAAVKLYREIYKASQKGQIGVTLSSKWFMPISQTFDNQKAAQRALDFVLGWFLHPMTYGDYPPIMWSLVGNRLPKFTEMQSQILKNSYDFLGLNYYTSKYAANAVLSNSVELSVTTDCRAIISSAKNGVPIGPPTYLDWLYVYPKGIRALVLHVKEKYGNPSIIITENGVADNGTLPVKEALKDEGRITYHHDHLTYLLKAIKEGVDVKGYFVWSFFDDFEWSYGYTARFGIIYIDYENGLKRYPKDSALWFKKFLQQNMFTKDFSSVASQ